MSTLSASPGCSRRSQRQLSSRRQPALVPRGCGSAWLSIYEERNQSISSGLSPICEELQRFQTQRKKCQEDARVTMQAANIFKRKFGRLEILYNVPAEQVASEVCWLEELVKSMSAGRDGLSSGSMH